MSTLLAGDTEWWSDEAIAEAFGPDERVFVLEKTERKRAGKAKSIVPANDDDLAKVLKIGYERVVFLSGELSGTGSERRDFEVLPQLLEQLSRQEGVQVLYVGTDEVDLERESGATVRQRALEDLCRWYRDNGVDLVILRCPRLSSPDCPQDYWRRMCEGLRGGNPWDFDVPADQPLDFVSMLDLARLVGTVFDRWERGPVLRLRAEADRTFSQAAERVRELLPGARLSFSDAPVNRIVGFADERDVADLYDFACSHDVLDDLETACRVSRGSTTRGKHLVKRVLGGLRAGGPALIALELVIGAVLVEVLNGILGNNVQFRMVDLRLVYVMVFAASYGVGTGALASVLMSVSLGWAFVQQGYEPLMLFYDPQNWVPFVLYFIVGCSLGYFHQRNEEDRQFAERRAERQEEQIVFLGGLYDEACDSRDSYRHDLLESRDGFGRIFDVVKRLSLEEPSRIFSASIGVLEDVLDTKKAALYIINDGKDGFARLAVCSGELDGRLRQSIRLESIRPALDTLESGEVWFNSKFESDMPSYVAGVRSEGSLRVLIMVYDVPFKQASSYYMNLIRILAGLMENFLIHAWHEEAARQAERYVEGTALLTREEFLEELDARREVRRRHIGDYRVLEVERNGKSLEDVDRSLAGQLRSTDSAGVGKGGRVYLLLRQVDDATLPIVERRFAKAGIEVKPCEDEGEI